MKLSAFKNRSDVRFKTFRELHSQYGDVWMDLMIPITSGEAVEAISLFGGKQFYPALCAYITTKASCGLYGPLNTRISADMLTTRAFPKYDIQCHVIKPGMLMRVNYPGIPIRATSPLLTTVPLDLKNVPGTIIRVLKVHNITDCLEDSGGMDRERLNKYFVITELRDPVSSIGYTNLLKQYSSIFTSKYRVSAIELACRLSHATEAERRLYYRNNKI